MKVLIINTYYKGGGAEKVARSLYENLPGMGIETFFLAGRFQANVPNEIDTIYRSFWGRLYTTTKGFLLNNTLINSLYSRHRIIKTIRDKQIDIVHFHNIHGNYLGLHELPRIRKICPNVIVTMHDMWMLTGGCAHAIDCDKWKTENCSGCKGNISMRPSRHSVYIYRQKLKLRQCDIKWVVPSDWLYHICEESGMNADGISVVRNGIPLEKYRVLDKNALRKKHGIDVQKRIIMFVANGVNNVYKGYAYITKAVGMLTEGDKYAALVVGGEEQLNLSIDTYSYGYITSEELLVELYNIADVFILPSIADTLPYTPMEAMACGTPVIAFKTGGIPEIVTEDTGWLLSEKSAESIRDCIEYVFATPNTEELRSKSINSVEFIKQKYDERKMLNEYKELYNRVLEDQR